MRSLTESLLAGALVASLAWNGWSALRARGADARPPSDAAAYACASDAAAAASPPSDTASSACGGPAARAGCSSRCTPAELERLGLDAAQRAALERLADTACASSDRLEREADALERELYARLAAEQVDAGRVRALVTEVAALRRRSLESCVDGIVELRRTLTRAQVEALLACCAAPRADGEGGR